MLYAAVVLAVLFFASCVAGALQIMAYSQLHAEINALAALIKGEATSDSPLTSPKDLEEQQRIKRLKLARITLCRIRNNPSRYSEEASHEAKCCLKEMASISASQSFQATAGGTQEAESQAMTDE